MFTTFIIITHLGCVPLGESGSGFLICGVPFEQIHFQISDLSNPLWTRIHRITDLRDLKTDNWITDLRDLKTDIGSLIQHVPSGEGSEINHFAQRRLISN